MKKNGKIFLGIIIFIIVIIYMNFYKVHINPTDTLDLTKEEKPEEYRYFWKYNQRNRCC